MMEKLEIFCCYARKDQPLLFQLRTHMALLEREGSVTMWSDMDIGLGTAWEKEINKHLNSAHLILLLISPDFLASEYCYSKEMKQAMERHERGEAYVIPILLRPGIWQAAPFAKLQILPNNARAVTEWRNRDKALLMIAQGIERVVKEQLTQRTIISCEQPQQAATATNLYPKMMTGVVKHDWGDAPDVPAFFGRTKELLLLEEWIAEDHCRLVALVGMKGIGKTKLSLRLGREGIGKTDLSLKLARGIQEQFDYVIWRRLLNAPRVSEMVSELIPFLSDQQEVSLPETVSGQIARLLHYFRQSRCLVILDNVEMILQSGHYSPGYEDYGHLFEQIAEISHRSCLLLTSREKPPEIARLESKTGPVRSLEVKGLHYLESKKIFTAIGSFSGSKANWKQLNYLYNGNPLALELVAHHIKKVFFGSIAEFLKEGKLTFTDLRVLLDWHFSRLSDSHKEVMYWLAINREPTSLADLKEDLLSPVRKEHIVSTLHSLQKLIPLEKIGKNFTLQPVLIEYMTERFVEQIVEEVKHGALHFFTTHAMLKTTVTDDVRDIQSRLILKPIYEKLLEIYGNKDRLSGRLREILALLQEHFCFTPGYGGGNLLNLLCFLRADIRGYDFSALAVWHAYLRGVNAQEVNFAHAYFKKSVFTDTFGGTFCVAWSLQGEVLAAGTATGEIWLWDAATALLLRIFGGHTDWIWSVAFSPDGKTIASSSRDQTVRLWEVESGRPVKTLQGHHGAIYSVAFSPDGKTVISGSDDGMVHVWEVKSGQCLRSLQGHAKPVWSVAFSPDGKTVISGSDDGMVHMWDAKSGQCLRSLQGHTDWVWSVAFSPDGKTIASGSVDRTIRLWRAESGELLIVLRGHSHWIRSVAFSPDGRTLASSSDDQTVRLWEVSSGKLLIILNGHVGPAYSVAFSSDGKTVASGSNDRTIRLWKAENGTLLKTFQGHADRVASVAFSSDGKVIASGHEDGIVRLWMVSNRKLFKTFQAHTYWVSSVAFSSDGKTIASGYEDGIVRLWKVSSGTWFNILRDHTGPINTVAFSPDDKLVASGSDDRTVRLWEADSGKLLTILRGHSHWIRSVAFSPNGRTIATGSDDQTVRVWEVSNGKLLSILRGHANSVNTVAFSPAGKLIASGSIDQAVCLWEADSGKLLTILRGHSHWIRSVAFSPNGKTLASGSDDQTVRLWEVESGTCFSILENHSRVNSVASSPDGEIFVSGNEDGTINIWNGQTGECLQTLRSDKPYERMNITQVKGLTEIQKTTLLMLGAIEEE